MEDGYKGIIQVEEGNPKYFKPEDIKAYAAYMEAHPNANAFWTPHLPMLQTKLLEILVTIE